MFKRQEFALALVALFPTAVSAEIQNGDQLFKALCVGEKSTGFLWKQNDWVFTHFKPGKYIVEKVKIETPPTPTSWLCSKEPQNGNRMEGKDSVVDRACYNVRDFNEPATPLGSGMCFEEWSKTGGKLVLNQVRCKSFAFKPNGYFHAVEWESATLEAKKDYKDSMEITVGTCSVIE